MTKIGFLFLVWSFFSLEAHAFNNNWPLRLRPGVVESVLASNAGNFKFAGYCDPAQGDVEIHFGLLSFSAPCNPVLGTYLLYTDVSAEVSTNPIQHCAEQGSTAFLCSLPVENTLAPPGIYFSETHLENITLANEKNYIFSGNCSPSGAKISVDVGEQTAAAAGVCKSNHRFNLEADLSVIPSGLNIPVTARITFGAQTGQSVSSVHKFSVLDPIPVITSHQISVTEADGDSWLEAGDQLEFTLEFSEEVNVDPAVALVLNLQSGNPNANYISGSGTREIKFSYTLQNGDVQCDGALSLLSVATNGQGVKDVSGQSADLSALPSWNTLKLDAAPPDFGGGFYLASSDATPTQSPVVVGEGFLVSDLCSPNPSFQVRFEDESDAVVQNLISLPSSAVSDKTYRAVSGVEGFNFLFTSGVLYHADFVVEDLAGNQNTFISPSWNVSSAGTLPNLIAHLSGKTPVEILDENGMKATESAFTGNVQTFKDVSQSTHVHNFSAKGSTQRPLYFKSSQETSFDGVNDCMTTSNHSELNTATVTQRSYGILFKTGSDVSTRQMIYEEGAQVRGMNVYISDGKIYCGFWNQRNDGDGYQAFVSHSQNISPNTTYHILSVFDYTNYAGATGPDGSFDCYMDGVAMASSLSVTSRLYAHSGNISLGCNGDATIQHDGQKAAGQYFKGKLKEVMIFNSPPDAQEARDIQNYLESLWGFW